MSEQKTAVIPPIRCTPEERRRFDEAARAAGKSLSQWLRDLANRAYEEGRL